MFEWTPELLNSNMNLIIVKIVSQIQKSHINIKSRYNIYILHCRSSYLNTNESNFTFIFEKFVVNASRIPNCELMALVYRQSYRLEIGLWENFVDVLFSQRESQLLLKNVHIILVDE